MNPFIQKMMNPILSHCEINDHAMVDLGGDDHF